jgi:CheY-like chemotaxis protein
VSHPQPPRESILVVDDALPNLRLLSEVLGRRGYRVRPASSGPLALQSARAAPPDLILLDITMREPSPCSPEARTISRDETSCP